MIKAIVLDDEQHCVESLCLDLERYCPEVDVVAAMTSVKDCLAEVKKVKPDLLFLDIEMPWMNGFEFIDFLQPIDFEVIFVTAYDSYALKAFRASAVDYLMKPVDKNDLIEAVNKVISRKSDQSGSADHMKQLLDQYFSRQKSHKITIPDKDGQTFISLEKIIYIEASSNYSNIHLEDGTTNLVTMTLKHMHQKLNDERFVRVHHSFIINMDHVFQYIKSEGGYLVMTDQSKIPISRSKRSEIKEIIESEFH